MENQKVIVFDNGSGYTKIGYSGEEHPRNIFPTIIGTGKYLPASEKGYCYGEEVSKYRTCFKI